MESNWKAVTEEIWETNMWKLNNKLLNNQQIKEITQENYKICKGQTKAQHVKI